MFTNPIYWVIWGSLMMNAAGIKIGAFNVKTLGPTKMGKPDVVEDLVSVISQYDIILIQEIRDASLETMPDLLVEINEENGAGTYNYTISARLGRTSYREQYSFVYKTAAVSLDATYQYPDTSDYFVRPPYCAKFSSSTCGTTLPAFGLCALHTPTDDTEDEIDKVPTAYDDIVTEFNTYDIMIIGDLNCDCDYVSATKLALISLWTNTSYEWLIGNDADTTVSGTDCAYDRLVLAGSALKKFIVPDSIKVDRFDITLGLTPTETAAVSDHYPVQLEFADKPVNRRTALCFVVSDVLTRSAATSIQTFATETNATIRAYFDIDTMTDSSGRSWVTGSRQGVTDVGTALSDFDANYPSLLSESDLDLVDGYLSVIDNPPTIDGYTNGNYTGYDIVLEYCDESFFEYNIQVCKRAI